jgi:hypothetical protein
MDQTGTGRADSGWPKYAEMPQGRPSHLRCLARGTLGISNEFAPALPLRRPVVRVIDLARENSGEQQNAHRRPNHDGNRARLGVQV